MRYRVMVQGEDGMEFCTASNVTEARLAAEIRDAEEDYPCGQVWVEEE